VGKPLGGGVVPGPPPEKAFCGLVGI